MRRPASLACVAVATLLAAAPAGAQRVFSRAFEPAVTPFVGISDYGYRATTGSARAEYNNSLNIGIQGERPLSRRTALMGTLIVAPLTRVQARVGQDDLFEYDRALSVGGDVGIAARLKPAAPAFGYLGAGFHAATRGMDPEGDDGMVFEPRGTFGAGLDLARRARTGVRILWLGHYTVPAAPQDAEQLLRKKAGTFDWTLLLGFRHTLGAATEAAR